MFRLSIFTIIVLSVQVIVPMEIVRKNKNEKALCELLQNVYHCFGHKDLSNFAKVNKVLRKSVLDTAKKVQDTSFKSLGFFVEQKEKNNSVVFKLWNSYATVCTAIALEYNTLYLRQYSLNNNRKINCRLGS